MRDQAVAIEDLVQEAWHLSHVEFRVNRQRIKPEIGVKPDE
jgi:hypothetical protein